MQAAFLKNMAFFSFLSLVWPLLGQERSPSFALDTAQINTYLKKGEAYWQEQQLDSMDRCFQWVLNVTDQQLPRNTSAVDSLCLKRIWEELHEMIDYFIVHGHYNYALTAGTMAASYFEEANQPNLLASAYQALGTCYGHLSRRQTALEYWQRALSIKESTSGSKEKGMTYNNIGTSYSAMGDQETALVYLKKALETFKEEEGYDSEDVLLALNNIGFGHQMLDQFDSAMEYYREAEQLSIKLKGAESLSTANVYNNIASVLHAQGQYEQTLPYLKRGIKPWEERYGYLHPYTCTYHLELGRNYTQLGHKQEALTHLQTALRGRLASLGLHHFMTSFAYFGLAEYYGHNNQQAQALLYIDSTYQALRFDPNEPARLSEVSYFPLLLKALQKEIDLLDTQEQSVDLLRRTCTPCQSLITVIEHLHHNVYNARASRRIRATLKPVLNKCISVSAKRFDLSREQAAYQLALTISEWNKAVSLFSELKDMLQKQASRVPDSLVIKEWAIERQIQVLDRQIQSATEEGAVAKLENLRFIQQEALRRLIRTYERVYPDYYSLRFGATSPLTIAQFQEELFTPASAEKTLLEYYVGEEYIYLFLIQKDHHDLYTFPLDFALDESIKALEEGLCTYFLSSSEQTSSVNLKALTEQYVREAQLLYEKLLFPLADKLTDELIFIPDERLHFVPFELLLTAPPGELQNFSNYPYLLKDKVIGYAFNLQVLQKQVQKKLEYIPEKRLLALAPFATIKADQLSDSTTTHPPFPDASPLIGSGAEAHKIAQLWAGSAIRGPLATKQTFCELAPGYTILHLATHAKSDTLFGEESYISFAPTNDYEHSSQLKTNELLQLRMDCELVVLSACETAGGEYLQGEGVISISRAFALAGAKSTITALWPAENQSTKAIMLELHEALRQGMPKHCALRQAKLNYLLRTPGFQSHPFFWGGIIFIGDELPIRLP